MSVQFAVKLILDKLCSRDYDKQLHQVLACHNYCQILV